MVQKSFAIPFWVGFTIAIINLFLTIYPLYNLFLALPVSILFLVLGMGYGFINKPRWLDFILVPIILFVALITAIIIGLVSIIGTSFFLLLVVGLVADGIAFLIERVPVIGDLLSSGLVFLVIWLVIGGVNGLVLASIASIIALIPLHFFPFITLTFISLKIATILIPLIL